MKVMIKLLPFNFLVSQRSQLIRLSLLGLMIVIIIGACQQIPTWLSSTTSGLAQQQTPSAKPSPIPTDNGIRYGYIDNTGKFVIPPKYLEARPFKNGAASVTTAKGKTYVNREGKELAPPGLYTETDFIEGGCDSTTGLCAVIKNQKIGYIDLTGKLAIPLQRYGFGKFSEGLAAALGPVAKAERSREEVSKYGYIDQRNYRHKNREFVIPPQFDEADDFHDGAARVGSKKIEPDPKQTGKMKEVTYYGFIDKTGRYTFPPIGQDIYQKKYKIAQRFHEGLAWINNEEGERTYIDVTGKVVISGLDNNVDFPSGWDFQEGLAIATRGKQRGFINKKGEFVILLPDEQYYDFRPFSEGLAAVALKGKGWGYMNQKGEWVIKPQFESVGDFRDGIALIGETLQDYPRQTGSNLINREGKFLLRKLEGSSIRPASVDAKVNEGLIPYASDTGLPFGYATTRGEFLIPSVGIVKTPSVKQVLSEQFQELGNFSEGLAVVGVRQALIQKNSESN
jgi:hypothetical protein